ncbi:uncharacterized [Tachysurus ichikawai]
MSVFISRQGPSYSKGNAVPLKWIWPGSEDWVGSIRCPSGTQLDQVKSQGQGCSPGPTVPSPSRCFVSPAFRGRSPSKQQHISETCSGSVGQQQYVLIQQSV